MKLNKVTASLITVMGTQALMGYAYADRIIQRPAGAFYIVSDQEAALAFDRNSSFLMLPPTLSTPVYNTAPLRPKHKQKSKRIHSKKAVSKTVPCVPVECPITPTKPVKPVTTIEPAESIFLRLEKKK